MSESPKGIIYNDDGWSSYMRYPAPMSPEDIIRVTVAPLIGTHVKVYQFCALGGHAVNYNSSFLPRIGEMINTVETMHVWRMRETLRCLETLGTDPLHIVSKACHDHSIACQFSLRMNDRHHTYQWPDGRWYFPELLSEWITEHPDLVLEDHALDYAQPGVHDYRMRQIKEVLDHYDVDGIDLDFTRFKPWFRPGQEPSGSPLLTALMRQLREMTAVYGKTLSARFEYDPQACIDSGLDVETWLSEGLLDQITLGGVADHTPDAPCRWWVERSQASGCKVYPGIEGHLHWISSCGSGGCGTHASVDGVNDGYGPPSAAYARAVAAVHYENGADGISLFNFTCADGHFSRELFTELAEPDTIKLRDKQYVAAVWPWDIDIYRFDKWQSRFAILPGETTAEYCITIADDFEVAGQRALTAACSLTLDLQGINAITDIEVYMNSIPLTWNGYNYNHYDHGCWNDICRYNVPLSALIPGENKITLRKVNDTAGFDGAVEVRKCILEINYDNSFEPGKMYAGE